jgi:hypothetical protein
MRWAVVIVEHSNHDPQESAEFGHFRILPESRGLA